MATPLLSAKLVALRKQFGYSQQEVADYLRLTREGYSHYERNAREPSLESLVKLSKLYHVDINELINEKTVMIPSDMSQHIIPIQNEKLYGKFRPAESSSTIIDNIEHFLKLFTGKNLDLDLKDITKDDIATLAQYKKLDSQCQEEVQQFIKFKHFISKGKK